MEGATIRSKTVRTKDTPTTRAARRRRVLSITKYPKFSVYNVSTSEVISRIIAITASKMVISDTERGNSMCLTLYHFAPYFNVF